MTTKKPLKQRIKDFFINLGKLLKKELSDGVSGLTFVLVCIVVSSEVGVMYLLYFITLNEGFAEIATTMGGIGGLPGLEFIPLCLAITVGIKAIINKVRSKKKNGH